MDRWAQCRSNPPGQFNYLSEWPLCLANRTHREWVVGAAVLTTPFRLRQQIGGRLCPRRGTDDCWSPLAPGRSDRHPAHLPDSRASGPRIGGVFRRLTAWLRRKHEGPPEDLDTREELEAREEGRRLLEDKDTYRALGRSGPDMTSGARRDAGRR